MAMSTYFNLDFHQTPNSQVSTFYEETPALAPEHHLLAYPHESFFFLPNTTFDYSYFDHPSFLYPAEIYPHFLPCAPSYDPITSLYDETIFPPDDCNFLPCSKRQKCFYDKQEHEHSSALNLVQPNFFDGSMPSEELPLPPPEAQQLFSAMPEFKVPQNISQGAFGANNDAHRPHYEKKTNEKITISAQSLAARERRRKITEKTQELGKLVPGGSKMNTAEMLHAAGKYVQYLQAQVEMLELMKTLQEEEAAPSIDELHLQALLVSPSLQEKMYSEEKCIVPKDFVTTLTNHDNLRSSPSILKDLKQLIATTDIKNKEKQE